MYRSVVQRLFTDTQMARPAACVGIAAAESTKMRKAAATAEPILLSVA